MGKRYSIEIDDGKVEIEVFDSRKKSLGLLLIDPNDLNIFDRLEKAEVIINKATNEVDELIKKNAKDRDIAAAVKRADDKIKKELDYIFDYDVSDTIFKNTNCLSTHRGVPMIEDFINKIMPVLSDVTGTELKVNQRNIRKHTSKYVNRR